MSGVGPGSHGKHRMSPFGEDSLWLLLQRSLGLVFTPFSATLKRGGFSRLLMGPTVRPNLVRGGVPTGQKPAQHGENAGVNRDTGTKLYSGGALIQHRHALLRRAEDVP